MIQVKNVIVNSMMNENFKTCKLKNWNHELGNEKWFKLATQYITKFEEMKINNLGMLICGEPGTGKTYFSSCIANELLSKLVPVAFVSTTDLMSQISKSKRSFGDKGLLPIINALENTDLLILDDLGREEDNRWTRALIYMVIEKRISSKLPLIITTNMKIPDLMARYDEITYSRITEMCSLIKNSENHI